MIKPVPITTAGFGTLSMTWVPKPVDRKEAIKTMKYVYDKYGVKFFNGGEFYQLTPEYINLELLRDFVIELQDPELIISVKGGIIKGTLQPDGGKENIDKSINNIVSYFKDVPVKPKIIFELARVDPKVPYEETVGYIYEHVKTGNIDGISLTEVSAQTIKKIAQIAPISFIEEEFSLFAPDIILGGVLAEASKHGIPVVAYSPLCRGILTDYAAEHPDFLSTLHDQDFKKHLDKFTPEIFAKNVPLLQLLYQYAHSKGVFLENLALGYIQKVSEAENFEGIPKVSPVIAIPSGSTIEKIDKNFKDIIQLSDADFKEVVELLHKRPVVGLRYNELVQKSGLLSA